MKKNPNSPYKCHDPVCLKGTSKNAYHDGKFFKTLYYHKYKILCNTKNVIKINIKEDT